jgi:hypothetical protein
MATVSTTEPADDRPTAKGIVDCGLPYASRDVKTTDSASAGRAAVSDTLNELRDAHGSDGWTIKRNGEPATLLASLALVAANVFVPNTLSQYGPLTVAV